jgi:hypothetical protein
MNRLKQDSAHDVLLIATAWPIPYTCRRFLLAPRRRETAEHSAAGRALQCQAADCGSELNL